MTPTDKKLKNTCAATLNTIENLSTTPKNTKLLIDKLLNNNKNNFVGVSFHITTQGNVAVNSVGCGVSMQARGEQQCDDTQEETQEDDNDPICISNII